MPGALCELVPVVSSAPGELDSAMPGALCERVPLVSGAPGELNPSMPGALCELIPLVLRRPWQAKSFDAWGPLRADSLGFQLGHLPTSRPAPDHCRKHRYSQDLLLDVTVLKYFKNL